MAPGSHLTCPSLSDRTLEVGILISLPLQGGSEPCDPKQGNPVILLPVDHVWTGGHRAGHRLWTHRNLGPNPGSVRLHILSLSLLRPGACGPILRKFLSLLPKCSSSPVSSGEASLTLSLFLFSQAHVRLKRPHPLSEPCHVPDAAHKMDKMDVFPVTHVEALC